MADSDVDDTACETCHSLEANGMLLCSLCDRGYHMACLVPPLAKEPPEEEDWFCPLCTDLRRSDTRYLKKARVRVFWPVYGDWFVGWVVGVRASTDEETKLAETKVACGAPIYQVFYAVDDVRWQFLNEGEFLPVDEADTTLKRGTDMLLHTRVLVWHTGTDAVPEGYYSGVVKDVISEKVQRMASRTLHLVHYDDGDVHWHDLAQVTWKPEAQMRKVKAAFGVNAVGGRSLKRPVAEADGFCEATAAAEAGAQAAAEVAALAKEQDFRRIASEKLQRALLVGNGAPGSSSVNKAAPGSSSVKRQRLGDATGSARVEEAECEHRAACVAELAQLKEMIESSRGEALVSLLRSLVDRQVDREGLRSSGVAKLVGRLERLEKDHVIAMAGDAGKQVQEAAKALTAAWMAQIQAATGSATTQALNGCGAADDKTWASREMAWRRAQAIVECIIGRFDSGKERSTTVRRLEHNLSEPRNSGLRARVLGGKLAPIELVHMDADALAPPELVLQRMASREASKRSVIIPGDTDQPFGLSKPDKERLSLSGLERERPDAEEENEYATEEPSGPHRACSAGADPAGQADDDNEVLEVGEVTRAERDARGRAAAVNLIDSDDDDVDDDDDDSD